MTISRDSVLWFAASQVRDQRREFEIVTDLVDAGMTRESAASLVRTLEQQRQSLQENGATVTDEAILDGWVRFGRPLEFVDPRMPPPAAQSLSPTTAPSERPSSPDTCVKCGSSQVAPHVQVLDRVDGAIVQSLSARVERNPTAWIFKDAVDVQLHARVCGSCGFVELYASSPKKIWDAYQQQRLG